MKMCKDERWKMKWWKDENMKNMKNIPKKWKTIKKWKIWEWKKHEKIWAYELVKKFWKYGLFEKDEKLWKKKTMKNL